MAQILWENKVIVCDICRERPLKKVIQIRGEFKGVCVECEEVEVKEVKNDFSIK